VGFIEQDIPFAVVIVIVEINDAFFLFVAQVVGTIIKNSQFLLIEHG